MNAMPRRIGDLGECGETGMRHDAVGAIGDAVRLESGNFADLTRGLPARARMVLSIAMGLPKGSLKIRYPDGRSVMVGGKSPGPDAELILNNWKLPAKAFSGATIGVAESYMDGDWESPDVTTFLELFAVNNEAGNRMAAGASWVLTMVQRLRHWFNDNTRAGSRRNISSHYDLGNDFYREWLDPTHDLFIGAL